MAPPLTFNVVAVAVLLCRATGGSLRLSTARLQPALAVRRQALAVAAAAAHIDGPMLMNQTRMSVKGLPEGSRHINGKTMSADWFQEYTVDQDELLANPAPAAPAAPAATSSASPSYSVPAWKSITLVTCSFVLSAIIIFLLWKCSPK